MESQTTENHSVVLKNHMRAVKRRACDHDRVSRIPGCIGEIARHLVKAKAINKLTGCVDRWEDERNLIL